MIIRRRRQTDGTNDIGEEVLAGALRTTRGLEVVPMTEERPPPSRGRPCADSGAGKSKWDQSKKQDRSGQAPPEPPGRIENRGRFPMKQCLAKRRGFARSRASCSRHAPSPLTRPPDRSLSGAPLGAHEAYRAVSARALRSYSYSHRSLRTLRAALLKFGRARTILAASIHSPAVSQERQSQLQLHDGQLSYMCAFT
jgi:hypothetical protein